jgi:hypothetical protein
MFCGPVISRLDVYGHEWLEYYIQRNERKTEDEDYFAILGEKVAAGLVLFLFLGVAVLAAYGLNEWHRIPWFSLSMMQYKLMVAYVTICAVPIIGYWYSKIRRMRKEGKIWRQQFNTMLDWTRPLSAEERKELYAIMLAVAIDVRQQKINGQMIGYAYSQGYNDGWWYSN